jgi:four helix bundle protein
VRLEERHVTDGEVPRAGRIDRFRDLIAWQKARALTRNLYAATREEVWKRDYALGDQLRRASVSIMANIAEGKERGTANEYHHFLCTAKASCAEVCSHLYVALDVGYLSEGQFDDLLAQAEEVARLIGGLRAAIARRRTHSTHAG